MADNYRRIPSSSSYNPPKYNQKYSRVEEEDEDVNMIDYNNDFFVLIQNRAKCGIGILFYLLSVFSLYCVITYIVSDRTLAATLIIILSVLLYFIFIFFIKFSVLAKEERIFSYSQAYIASLVTSGIVFVILFSATIMQTSNLVTINETLLGIWWVMFVLFVCIPYIYTSGFLSVVVRDKVN